MKKLIFYLIVSLFYFNGTTFSQTNDELDHTTKISPLFIAPANQNGYGDKSNQLAQPDDVEFLADGSLLVSDVNNNRLQHFSSSGEFLKSISAEDLHLKGEIFPTGIGQDKEGYIYVSLEAAGTIVRLNPDLTFDQFIGKSCDIVDNSYHCPGNEECLLTPQGLVVSAKGDVFIIDMDVSFRQGANGNIRNFAIKKFKKIDDNGTTKFVFDTNFATTQEITKVMRKSEGMAIDESRNIIFVAEEKPIIVQFTNKNKNRFIAAFDLDTGMFLEKLYGVTLKEKKILNGVFNESIEGVAVYKNYLFGVDEKNGCVRAFNIETGKYLGFWGHRAPFYCDDNSDCELEGTNYNEQTIIAGKAQPHLKNSWEKNELASPDGIAVFINSSGDHKLAVVDQWNSRVVIYNLNQIVEVLGD